MAKSPVNPTLKDMAETLVRRHLEALLSGGPGLSKEAADWALSAYKNLDDQTNQGKANPLAGLSEAKLRELIGDE